MATKKKKRKKNTSKRSRVSTSKKSKLSKKTVEKPQKSDFTKTKIVATIGPSSSTEKVLCKMIDAGVDVFRLNFSHGTHESQKKIYDLIRGSIHGADTVAILVDLSGPKFRIGLVSEPFELKRNDKLILTSDNVIGNEKNKRLSVSHKNLPREVKKGSTLWINDGLVGLTVEKIEGPDIHCVCFADGSISSRKGINAPDIPLSLYFPTPKDIEDAQFCLENMDPEPDFFAASFIRRPEDLDALRDLIETSFKKTKIIAKIEHTDALEHIDKIVEKSDGIMVARGDLGIEIPTEDVPIWQKRLIEKCNLAGKPVITATQMLESMTINKRPTRAEASDVSNAVLDGTDAVMLSGETASGKYPIEAVEYMDKIAKRVEGFIFKGREEHSPMFNKSSIPEMLGYNAYILSKTLPLKAILAITRTGGTARIISKFRPEVPILACTGVVETARQLRLTWGVTPIMIPIVTKTNELTFKSIKECLNQGFIHQPDMILVVAGNLLGIPSKTNLLQVLKVEDVLSLEQTFLME